MKKMKLHLRLELTTEQERKDWELVKSDLGIKSNTEALRALIRQKANNIVISNKVLVGAES